MRQNMTAERRRLMRYMGLMIIGAFALRLLLAALSEGHPTDMACWRGWADRIFQDGFGAFYSDTAFSDYPPGYMYVLWVLGAVRSVFGSNVFTDLVLVKLPAILCDLATGYLIFRISLGWLKDERHALLCMALYLFNPAILINSSAWGQVDAVLTLCVVLLCYFISQKKLPLAYAVFAVGFLLKPQMAFVFPVLVCAVIEQVFLHDFSIRKFGIHLASGVAAILGMILVSLPFGLEKVVSQYMQTVTSYPKATINAYNLWALFNKNWRDQTEVVAGLSIQTWGTILLVLVFAAAVWFWFRSKKNHTKVYFISAFLYIAIFTVSVRMHERYMFPALALLILVYALCPKREFFWSYIVFSVLHFFNVYDVFVNYDASNFDWNNPVPIVAGGLMVLATVWLCCQAWMYYTRPGTLQEQSAVEPILPHREHVRRDGRDETITPSERAVRIVKWDVLIICLISAVYALIAFHDLGDMDAPDSGWEASGVGDEIVLDLGETVTVSEIHYYLGNYHRPKFSVSSAEDLSGTWTTNIPSEELVSVFKWQEFGMTHDIVTRYLRFSCESAQAALWELVLIDSEGNRIIPENADEYPGLFDERNLYPVRTTYLNSTYFDEIYHARTAYEYIHGLYSYENTHPPLGKFFISLGIRAFGMNPFGWRCVGTLFGVLMIPCIYLFAKRFFKKTWMATVVTLLFTFDFMHFVQTRIATIDVYITFFVILMYYFMYRYTQMSFYDTALKKTWIPLGLCGISMGLGIASKWTGVYAGVGLAVIFFAALYRRYREYRYAAENPQGSTNGISHQHVIQTFAPAVRRTIVFCIVFFVIIPVIIYTLSYIPFRDNSTDGLITRMIHNQITMFDYHSNLVSEHSFSSRWYQWPLMTRPIWFYSGHVSDTVSEGISSFGNPLVWWAGIGCFIYMLYLIVKKRDRRACFLTVAYLAQYVPWMFVTRTTYIYHYFPSVPFVTMMVGYTLFAFAKDRPRRKALVFAYTAAAIGLFALFYPVLSGHGVSLSFADTWLKWFESWVLVV